MDKGVGWEREAKRRGGAEGGRRKWSKRSKTLERKGRISREAGVMKLAAFKGHLYRLDALLEIGDRDTNTSFHIVSFQTVMLLLKHYTSYMYLWIILPDMQFIKEHTCLLMTRMDRVIYLPFSKVAFWKQGEHVVERGWMHLTNSVPLYSLRCKEKA
jgi:hypothetical protein